MLISVRSSTYFDIVVLVSMIYVKFAKRITDASILCNTVQYRLFDKDIVRRCTRTRDIWRPVLTLILIPRLTNKPTFFSRTDELNELNLINKIVTDHVNIVIKVVKSSPFGRVLRTEWCNEIRVIFLQLYYWYSSRVKF